MRIVSAGTQGKGGGERGGDESDAMDAAPTAVWDVQPSLAGAAVSGASGGIGSRHSDTRHQTASAHCFGRNPSLFAQAPPCLSTRTW